jgi:hypothetical protein
VLVEGAGLALAHLAVDISADRTQATGRLKTAAGELLAPARLDDRGYVAEAGGGEGVAARRADEDEIDEPFTPPEIVASAAVPVAGGLDDPGASDVHLLVAGVMAPPPVLPELDGQRVSLGHGGAWDIDVGPPDLPPADELREIRERTHHVAKLLADDLGVAALSPEEAMAAGRGDCTAHAVVLARDLAERGYDARLVTGYVLGQGALRRHRWVVVRLGKDWIPVDPTFDEVPASPRHLALAVTGASLDELAFIDDIAFAGWGAARAELAR